MFNKCFSNQSTLPKRTIHEQAESKVFTVHIHDNYTEEEKIVMQEDSSCNLVFCPPLTREEKIQNSKELKNFPGFICYPPPESLSKSQHGNLFSRLFKSRL